MSKIEEGSFIKVDYVSKMQEDDSIFDTTFEEVAKKSKIYDAEKVYEPLLLVVGSNWFPPKVEEALIGKRNGDIVNVSINSSDAFGSRDPSNIKLVPRREFQKMQINPQKGDWVTVGNQEGKVLSVTSGRVRIDFNHRLAGADLTYEITIKEVIDDVEGRIQAIIGRRLPGADLADATLEINGDVVRVELPRRVLYFEYIQFAKKSISQEIKEMIQGFKEVVFIERFRITDEE